MATRKIESDCALALARLRELGLLLESDVELKSLATLVSGGAVRGSWWGHPAGKRIYAAAMALEDHPDVVVLALVKGKRTYVHRHLWPALLAMAQSREMWQTKGLPAAAGELLAEVERSGVVRLEDVATAGSPRGRLARAQARELEARLLIHAVSEHAESGAHEMRLVSWRWWRQARKVKGRLPSHAAARAELELAAAELGQGNEKALFPWQGQALAVGRPRAAVHRRRRPNNAR